MKEKKAHIEDALHATRAAIEEGIVPGGGVALLYAAKALDGLTPENDDQKVGIDIVRRALQSPVRQVAENAGTEGFGRRRQAARTRTISTVASTRRPANMSTWSRAGIIDPTKVVRLSSAERRFGGGPVGDDRGNGRRKAREEGDARDAAWRRNGRDGRFLASPTSKPGRPPWGAASFFARQGRRDCPGKADGLPSMSIRACSTSAAFG